MHREIERKFLAEIVAPLPPGKLLSQGYFTGPLISSSGSGVSLHLSLPGRPGATVDIPPQRHDDFRELAGSLDLSQGVSLSLLGAIARIRISEDEAIIGVKGEGSVDRPEIEFGVSMAHSARLWGLCAASLSKVRHMVGGWSLDVYQGSLSPLVVAEAELDSLLDPLPPVSREFVLLRELSEDRSFSNASLSALSPLAARALVRSLGPARLR